MSRLTKRINHHYTPRKDIRLGAYSECVQKLGKLEDLEEQGRLIELPCKVGDEVWVVVHNELYFWNEDPEYFIAKTKFGLSSLKQIGKKIFLTEEEALAKLKELKGE